MNAEIYDILRMAMFGCNSLSIWSEKELADRNQFIEWAIKDSNVLADLPDYTESEVRIMLSEVFDEELKGYRRGIRMVNK